MQTTHAPKYRVLNTAASIAAAGGTNTMGNAVLVEGTTYQVRIIRLTTALLIGSVQLPASGGSKITVLDADPILTFTAGPGQTSILVVNDGSAAFSAILLVLE